jgi:hypothetical protein
MVLFGAVHATMRTAFAGGSGGQLPILRLNLDRLNQSALKYPSLWAFYGSGERLYSGVRRLFATSPQAGLPPDAAAAHGEYLPPQCTPWLNRAPEEQA